MTNLTIRRFEFQYLAGGFFFIFLLIWGRRGERERDGGRKVERWKEEKKMIERGWEKCGTDIGGMRREKN
jgi:hypothetical protein